MYAWIIDRDHLAEEEMKVTGRVEDDETRRAPLARLTRRTSGAHG